MKGILNSYDSELLHSADHSPQLIARLEEAEDMVQKVEAHTAEMEVMREADPSKTCPSLSYKNYWLTFPG